MSSEKTIWPGSTQLAPVPVILAGSGNGRDRKYNLITLAWAGIVCSEPPMIGISIRPERFSYPVIRELGEFTVNMPSRALAADVDYCGVASGRDVDKFAERHLTPRAGSRVAAPIVEECPVSLECRLKQVIPLGSHDLFLGEILAIQVDTALIDDKGRLDIDRADLLAYAHGHYYELGKCIGHFGYSVRKKPGPRIRK